MLSSCASKSELNASLSLLREELQLAISDSLSNRKSECDWNHIDFDELQTYMDGKIEEALADKVGKKYFEASLLNLKEAWELEERTIYEAIGAKADAS
jgi:hypothetical protein